MILGLWKYKTRNNDKLYWVYESTKQETMINDTGLMKVQNKKQWLMILALWRGYKRTYLYLTKTTLDENEDHLAYEMGSTTTPVFGLELLISKMALRTMYRKEKFVSLNWVPLKQTLLW